MAELKAQMDIVDVFRTTNRSIPGVVCLITSNLGRHVSLAALKPAEEVGAGDNISPSGAAK